MGHSENRAPHSDAATASGAASSTASAPTGLQAIRAALLLALDPCEVDVIDDSHLHAGHSGAREGGHYTVRILSPRFAGLSRVARHRLVYDALKGLFRAGIHALAIEARSPQD